MRYPHISKLSELDLEVTGLSVLPTSATIYEGGLKSFTAVAEYNFGPSQIVTGQAAWESSDPSIMAPTATPGLVEASAIGEAVLTVSLAGFTVQANVDVLEAPLVDEAVVFVRSNALNIFDVWPRDRWYYEDDAHADIMILQPISPRQNRLSGRTDHHGNIEKQEAMRADLLIAFVG